MKKNNVIVIVGPTASGKTSLGIELAKKLNGQIISADSMQIYRKLDIGTAKATAEEKKQVKHYLIDICDITENFSVCEYKKLCYEKISELLDKEILPIVVGGTGLYINAIVNNMSFSSTNHINFEYRKHLESLLEEKGAEYLYSMLSQIDYEAANKIHPNNTKRIIRALEIANNGISKSDIDSRNDLWKKNESPYNFIIIYIDKPREVLYDKINKRVEQMVSMGILEEVNYILESNISENSTALQAIGYKEFFNHIKYGEGLDGCVEQLKQNTRRYAKRQITWFNKLDKDIIYKDDCNLEWLIQEIKRRM